MFFGFLGLRVWVQAGSVSGLIYIYIYIYIYGTHIIYIGFYDQGLGFRVFEEF